MTINMKSLNKYIYITGISLGIITILGILTLSVIQFNEWSQTHKLHLQNPIKNFIKIDPRETAAKYPLIKQAVAKEKDPAKMATEEYICYVFGKDCKMALAVSQAENGTRQCDRFGVNTDKSIDFGVFQINTIHLKKGWTIAQLIDCHKNIDFAYEIYTAQSWQPWVAYQNGSYKQFLK
jgi:hypothetical protein